MKDWIPQIVIGIIVTVVGTLLANALLQGRGGKRHFFSGVHFSGPSRPGR